MEARSEAVSMISRAQSTLPAGSLELELMGLAARLIVTDQMCARLGLRFSMYTCTDRRLGEHCRQADRHNAMADVAGGKAMSLLESAFPSCERNTS